MRTPIGHAQDQESSLERIHLVIPSIQIETCQTKIGKNLESNLKRFKVMEVLFVPMFLTLFVFLVSSGDPSNVVQNLYCDLGLKNGLCPIDGGWTSWSPWGPCSGKCGFKGKRTRHRTCNNPSPSNNGAPCIGSSYQIDSCQIQGCTMNDYAKVVSTHPVRKGELRIVNEIHKSLPALAELCFLVDCTFPIVEKILGNKAMLYWNAMNCVKYDVGCPSPGGWSSWGAWSPCTAVCGNGEKYRTRICDSPIPSDSKLTCSDSAFEAKSCAGFNCKNYPAGTWTNWSKWGVCSVECGSGVRIRKRSCLDAPNTRGSSCKGASKEIKGCAINNCSVDGIWSSWTVWSACSSSCGIGTRMRNRMCNNPSPSGSGARCLGSASEIRQCFSEPCTVKTHEIAHFTEKSSLFYDTNEKPSRLLHMYLRFLPLSPFGMIIYRFERECKGSMCDFVKLFLQNGKIVLLSQITGCSLGVVHETKLDIGQWHVVLTAIYGTYGLLRVDDGHHKLNIFSCTPISYNLDHAMKIGEGFRGSIQEVAINFAPVQLKNKYSEGEQIFRPSVSNDIQYSMGDYNEGFLHVGLTDSVAVPCPKNMERWQVEDVNGVVAIIPDDSANKYVLLLVEEARVKLKFHHGTTYVSVESTDHISVDEWFEVVIVQDNKNMYMQVNGNEKKYVPLEIDKMITSVTNIFIGAIRDDLREKICSNCADIPQTSFTLGYLIIDGKEIDLITLPVLETTSKRFSSRTISISDYYEEVPLLLGQELKLSCLYDTTPREKGHTYSKRTYIAWLLMDKLLRSYENENNFFDLRDDGRVSTLSISSYTARDTVENFYSCHIYHNENTSTKAFGQTFFTFGVAMIDKREEFESTTFRMWTFICGFVVTCFVFLIIWTLFEIIFDVRNGHSFYKLPQNDSTESTVNFVLSKSGVTLLGGREAANEVASSILNDK